MKNLKQKVFNTIKTFTVVSVFAGLTSIHADDTEIFYTENISNNLLFVLDTSGSMNEKIVTTTVVGGGTSSTGGTVVEIDDKAIATSHDDATQTFEEGEEASAGDQVTDEDYLDFETDNIVATRFRINRNSIYQTGQSVNSWWWHKLEIEDVRITNAYLKFFASSNNSEATTIKITADDTAHNYANSWYDAPNWYTNDYRYFYYHGDYPTISERPESTESIIWEPSAWTVGNTEDVDVTSLVQLIVDRSDWNTRNYDNSFAFKFETQVGDRAAYSYDGSSAESPELHIEFEYDYKVKWSRHGSWQYVNGETQSDIFTYTKNEYDDAEQEWSDSSITPIQFEETELVLDADRNVGLRFTLDDPIPEDAVILDAYLTLTSTADYNSSNEASINIQTKNTGEAAAFSSTNPILGSGYDSGINWIPNDWVADSSYRTPDLKANIQAIVDGAPVNNLAFRLFNEGDARNIYSFDGDTSKAPKLYIKYQDINGATPGTGTGTGGTTVITEVSTRLKVMQDALANVLQVAPEINVGLMKYSGMDGDRNRNHTENNRHHYVGGVVYPISPVYENASEHIGTYEDKDNLPNPGSKVVRDYLADVAYEWEAVGGTPIVDALYEAALYFRGEKAHFGRTKNNTNHRNSSGAHPASLVTGDEISDDVRDEGRSNIDDPYYKSPIINECQSTYLVLMSDGEPTYYYDDNWGTAKGPFARYVESPDNSAQTGMHSGVGSGRLASTIKAENPGGCLTGNGEVGNDAEKYTSGTCGREIAQYLATNDQMPDTAPNGSTGVEGDQMVKTFVIGFGPTTGGLSLGAEEYLKSLVTVDSNGYFRAEHKQELESAFLNIFDVVATSSGSLSSPGYSVNVKSGLEHEDDIYIPVFNRKNTSRWTGNLKKFKLVDDNGSRKIQGSNDKDAFDEYGAFSDDALDYWSNSPSTSPDGLEVEKGGVASLIDPVNRKIFSNLSCSGSGACNLNTENNQLTTTNTNITTAKLGVDDSVEGLEGTDTDALKNSLVNFMLGWEDGYFDSSATADADKGIKRRYMGDMLHTEPMVITYDKGDESGVGKEQYIFAATNEGYLHAFDVETGVEKFAFIPEELLENSYHLFKNAGNARDHRYGIDGVLTYWHDDKNHDGNVDVTDDDATSEKVYLFFGLRRGGRSYYALDITRINQLDPQPKLLWKKSNTDSGMGLLGQTWSAPYLARVGIKNGTSTVNKEVMIVSGGYDKADDRDDPLKPKILDDATESVTASMGKNIFILDMHNGDLLWDLNSSMSGTNPITNSIPGGARILDVNRNGLIDRMYFADTGGNVWRLDLSESLSGTADTDSKLTKFASLGGADTDSRKFYNEPDVASLSPDGKTIFTVSIGSGFRAHPKDKSIEDKMFILRDYSPFHALADDFSAITLDDLASVAIDDSGETITLTHSGFSGDTEIETQAEEETETSTDKGWYLSFPSGTGEKVLATAVTFDGIISFTTMVPQIVTEDVDVCAAPVSEGRFYAMNILTGEAGLNFDESEETNIEDRITDADLYTTIVKGEIPGKPQIVFNALTKEVSENDAGTVVKTTCSHPVDIRNGKKLSQVTGYDACRLESVYWNSPAADD